MKKDKNDTFTLTKDQEKKLIDYFAMEIFDHTTLPQMLNLVQKETYNYAKTQIEGNDMPNEEKNNILKRMLEFEERMANNKNKE